MVVALVFSLAACSGGDTDAAGPAQQQQPNILLIVLDDLGYNDLGINSGTEGQTPNLNHFASQGVRFTRNYVDSTCSVTRVGILTGTSPAARGYRPGGLGISPEIQTLPEVLRDAGYRTHHVGKWHLGYASALAWPHNQGYDGFYGFLNQWLLRGPHPVGELKLGVPTYLNPWLQRDQQHPEKQRGHLTDLLLQEVLRFLDDEADRSQPWFLSYWTYLPHTPVQPGEEFAARHPDTPEGRYLAMLAQVDDAVGQVLAGLDRSGQRDNTLVMIVSDNGGTNRYRDSNAPFVGVKMAFQEGGVRTPLLLRWPDGRGAGGVIDDIVSYLDYFPTLATAAGGIVPEGLPGRDISPLLSGGEVSPVPLMWDAGDSKTHAWSRLSADGRWRLHQFYTFPPVLNDLDADFTGGEDFSERYPEQFALMHREFLRWRDLQRTVDFSYERLDQSGRARLAGESLQRAPGFGGYTFGFAVQPDLPQHSTRQVLVSQRGQWSLVLEDGEIVLDINGIGLRAPAPAPGVCSPVVVTTLYVWNPFHPSRSEASLELYIDGELAAQTVVPIRHRHPDTYTEPTWMGQEANGNDKFNGSLGRPVILNERIRADDESDTWVANGLSRVSEALCATLSEAKLALGQE